MIKFLYISETGGYCFMVSKAEKQAIEYVMKIEMEKGNNPRNRSKDKMGYDIESGNKRIEVKGRSGDKASIVHFNQYNFASMQEAIREGKEYLLYIVKIIDDDNYKLKIMDVNEIIARAEVKHGYTIRFSRKDFE